MPPCLNYDNDSISDIQSFLLIFDSALLFFKVDPLPLNVPKVLDWNPGGLTMVKTNKSHLWNYYETAFMVLPYFFLENLLQINKEIFFFFL